MIVGGDFLNVGTTPTKRVIHFFDGTWTALTDQCEASVRMLNVHLGDELYLDLVDADGLASTTEPTELDHRYLYGQAIDQILAVETFDADGDPDELLWGLEDHQGTIRDVVKDILPMFICLKTFHGISRKKDIGFSFLFAPVKGKLCFNT